MSRLTRLGTTPCHSTLLAIGLLGATLVGCVEGTSVVILRNQKPAAGCVVSADKTVEALPFGSLDVGPLPDGKQNPGYLFTPLIQNGTVASAEDTLQNLLLLEGADVVLKPAPTAASIAVVQELEATGQARRTQLFSGSVEPGGKLGAAFPIIDADQVLTLRDLVGEQAVVQVVASVKVFGVIDGGDVVSPAFNYPVALCNGCLIHDWGSCDAIASDALVEPGGTCSPLQDEVLSCCTRGGATICPAVAPAAPTM